MQPRIGSELDALLNWQGLVVSTRILDVWVVIQNRRPDQHSTTFRLNGDSKTGEVGSAAGLNVIEIQEDLSRREAINEQIPRSRKGLSTTMNVPSKFELLAVDSFGGEYSHGVSCRIVPLRIEAVANTPN